jgi:hypothetical protein
MGLKVGPIHRSSRQLGRSSGIVSGERSAALSLDVGMPMHFHLRVCPSQYGLCLLGDFHVRKYLGYLFPHYQVLKLRIHRVKGDGGKCPVGCRVDGPYLADHDRCTGLGKHRDAAHCVAGQFRLLESCRSIAPLATAFWVLLLFSISIRDVCQLAFLTEQRSTGAPPVETSRRSSLRWIVPRSPSPIPLGNWPTSIPRSAIRLYFVSTCRR